MQRPLTHSRCCEYRYRWTSGYIPYLPPLLWPPNRFPVVSSSYFFFPSPILSRCRLDVYHTCGSAVFAGFTTYCEFRMPAGLKCAARGSLQIQDAKIRKKSPSEHHRTTLSGYIFATKASIANRKKNFLNSNTSSTYSHNMVNLAH